VRKPLGQDPGLSITDLGATLLTPVAGYISTQPALIAQLSQAVLVANNSAGMPCACRPNQSGGFGVRMFWAKQRAACQQRCRLARAMLGPYLRDMPRLQKHASQCLSLGEQL